ncbi:SCP2 sterol-binding domain-containing protein [Fodinicola feengrottensis]|uniref:SCP2 sterol-binding domain-containing protein n=1 Tax=Fodinicola feengrottensis TaxID=435914 RepID=A0ABP4VD03_9ACTN|nr:SCP2 sterol-binding domain-containing protein [Fodinicola feengrottensis]
MVDLSEAAVARLSPRELVAALKRLSPDDPALADVDMEMVARRIDPRRLSRSEFADLLSAIDTLAAGGAKVDLSTMDAATFLRIIGKASGSQIEAATAVPAVRRRILDELFRRMADYFRPERARDGRVVMQFRVTGGSGPGGLDHYSVVIQDRACTVSKNPSDDAKTTITTGPADLLRLATGSASPAMMFLRGKVKVDGSLGFASGFMAMFEMPKI